MMHKLSQYVLIFLSALGVLALSLSTQANDKVLPIQVAAVPVIVLNVDVTGTCASKGAIFKIVNTGIKWPRTAMLRIYHTDDKSVITERRLRLAHEQTVTFVVKKKDFNGQPVGVWIEPDWYQRNFKYDVKVNCT